MRRLSGTAGGVRVCRMIQKGVLQRQGFMDNEGCELILISTLNKSSGERMGLTYYTT